jgi:ribosomal protein S6
MNEMSEKKQDIKELQTTANVVGTTAIVQKVLIYEIKTFVMGNYIICTINCTHIKDKTLHRVFQAESAIFRDNGRTLLRLRYSYKNRNIYIQS